MSQYLNGHLLLAMPAIGDPRFERAAIYVCAHDEKGAMGIVINRLLPNLDFGKLLKDLAIESNIIMPPKLEHMPVLLGGPVETARGFLIHSNDFVQKDTIKVQPDVHVTGTVDAIIALSKDALPEHLIFALGYAGWTAGQLEKEIRENAWLNLPATPNLIFNTDIEHIWDRALKSLGVSPDQLSAFSGRA